MRSTFSLPKGRVKVERPASTASREPRHRGAGPPGESGGAPLRQRPIAPAALGRDQPAGPARSRRGGTGGRSPRLCRPHFQTDDIPAQRARAALLADDLLEETLGVGPLAPLMADPAVTDILVNRFDQVYIERFGKLERTSVRFRDPEHVVRIIQRIAAAWDVGSTSRLRWSMPALSTAAASTPRCHRLLSTGRPSRFAGSVAGDCGGRTCCGSACFRPTCRLPATCGEDATRTC